MDREKLKELIRTEPVLQETLDGLEAALARSAPDVDAMRAKQNEIFAKLEQIEEAKRQLSAETPVAEAATDETTPVAENIESDEREQQQPEVPDENKSPTPESAPE